MSDFPAVAVKTQRSSRGGLPYFIRPIFCGQNKKKEEKMPDTHKEIERKYLISMPDPSVFAPENGAARYEIEQIYLTSDDKTNRRIRCRKSGGATECTYTEKVRVSALVRLETEGEISLSAYEEKKKEADPACLPLQKIRYAIPYGGHLCEIDVFPFWKHCALLEIECESEEDAARLTLPPWVTLLREVTQDPDYTSHALSYPDAPARREENVLR